MCVFLLYLSGVQIATLYLYTVLSASLAVPYFSHYFSISVNFEKKIMEIKMPVLILSLNLSLFILYFSDRASSYNFGR
jgi:hypothetical protein